METFSALLAICEGISRHKGTVTRNFDVFLDLRPKKNGLANNRDTGDLRRYRPHYDVIVMY